MSSDCPVFPGSRVTPGDPRYPALIRGFNQRWVGHPHNIFHHGQSIELP